MPMVSGYIAVTIYACCGYRDRSAILYTISRTAKQKEPRMAITADRAPP